MRICIFISIFIYLIHVESAFSQNYRTETNSNHVPCEAGDSGTIYQFNPFYESPGFVKTGKFRVAYNDPFDISKSGFDFKGDVFITKNLAGVCLGTSYFNRSDNTHETRANAGIILYELNNDSIIKQDYFVSYSGGIIYFGEYFKTWFKTMRKDSFKEYFSSHYHHPGYKMEGNFIQVKKIIQKGIISGVNVYYGTKKTKSGEYQHQNDGSSNLVINPLSYTLPFISQFYTFGYHRRSSSHYGIQEFNQTQTHLGDYCEYINDFYIKGMFAPILITPYLDQNLEIKNQFPKFSNRFGVCIGWNWDATGAAQASFECGIMPGFGLFVKGNIPIFESAIQRSKTQMNNSVLPTK